jgi:hypothetical protein
LGWIIGQLGDPEAVQELFGADQWSEDYRGEAPELNGNLKCSKVTKAKLGVSTYWLNLGKSP